MVKPESRCTQACIVTRLVCVLLSRAYMILGCNYSYKQDALGLQVDFTALGFHQDDPSIFLVL